MANRMKEDEKNEKIIRNLLKLGPNRRCINCNSLGPQYVCTSFWTFVCTTCSGIHREFTHRVKSVSMAKFTSQEVTALQAGGNQHAKEIYFKEWDPQRHLLPDSSNVDRLRDFIKHVYVDKRYSGDRTIDRPPKGKVDDRDDTYESRRPDSYRSESRSPPYEDQYGDRRYLERPGPGDRRVELDRGRYDDRGYNDRTSRYSYDEKRSPGWYESDRNRYDRGYQDNRRHDDTYRRSPGHFESGGDRRSEDRFGNGSQNRRFEDRRLPEGPDRRRMEERSPNYQRDFGIGSPPPVRPVRDILGDDVPTLRVSDFPRANGSRDVEGSARSQIDGRKESHTQRTASSSSMGSVDGSSPSLKRANSGSLIDFIAEPEVPTAVVQQDPFAAASSVSQPSTAVQQDLFSTTLAPQPSTAVQQDLFSTTLAPQPSTAVQQDPFAGALAPKPSAAIQQDPFSGALAPKPSAAVQQDPFAGALAPKPSAAVQQDPFAGTLAPKPSTAVQQDLFAGTLAPQASSTSALGNSGWATFDLAPQPTPAPATAPGQGVLNLGQPSGFLDSFGQASSTGQWTPVQQVQGTMPVASGAYNWSTISQSVQQPNGVSNSQSWNGLVSSTMPTPPTASQNVQPAQSLAKQTPQTLNIGAQQGQNSAGSTRNGTKEIPEDFFKPAHAEPVLHSMGLQMGPQFGGVSGVQFPSVGMSLPGSMPYYVQPSKSKNPFDVLGEPPTAQGSMFPSMGSLQAALPNFNAGPVSVRDSGFGVLNNQWTSLNVPASYPAAATPGIYGGQQLPNAMPPKVQSGVPSTMGSFPTGSFSGDDLFSNFGGPVLPSQSSLSSVGGNPFG